MAISTSATSRTLGVQRTSALGVFSGVSSFQIAIRVALVIAIVASAVGYVVMVNAVSTQGLKLSELQRKADSLRAESVTLQLKATELQSLSSLADAVGKGGYAAAGDVEYISGSTNTLAQN